MKYLIDMPEGWRPRSRPLECDLCPKHWACRKSFGVCPLANAKKAVEVKSIAGYDLSAVSGGKLWATEAE